MSNNDLEKQIKDLNSKISELAVIVSLKTKEMDEIEKKYTERLSTINDYFSKIRNSLNIKEEKGTINDIDLINKLKALNYNDGSNEYIMIPTKFIRMTPSEKTTTSTIEVSKEKENNTAPYSTFKEGNHNRRKKMSCSYCNEKGHKRSQCPKILYNQE